MTPSEKLESAPLVEQVARAIFAKLNQQAAGHPLTDFDSEWANRRGDYMGMVTPSLVDQSVEAAQAAITIVVERLRKPTPEMRKAGEAEMMARHPNLDYFRDPYVDSTWQAMLDAALNDAPSTVGDELPENMR